MLFSVSSFGGRRLMRHLRKLAIRAAGVIFICTLSLQAPAQSPNTDAAADDNPPVANCNITPDTTPDPHDQSKQLATPIDSKLLTLGQPCHQVVSKKGLSTDELGNLQRGFDFYSWLTFIALNSPADGKTIGQGPRPGGDAATTWEALSNYRPLADVILADGSKPTGATRIAPDKCKPLDAPGKIILQLGEAAWNQPFKTGPLIDQGGHY